ncbi:MAG: 2-dehydropantoate 2-reductase [Desulfomonile tiedjei]|nr:2-dehydropantoate 2-reductase [Desulfomonile tiedjei]
MRIAMYGVGGVGGYFGWRLAQAGEDVVFVARGDQLKALKSTGLRVDTPDGNSSMLPVKAEEDPAGIGQVDAVILGVKAWQVSDAAHAIRPMIGPDTFVVPLQNGVDAPAELAKVLGPEHVFGGLCYIVALRVGLGHIRHAGMEPQVIFGELDNSLTERAKRLRTAFSNAGVKAEIPPDIRMAMWQKFLFIATLSGVAAVTRAPAGIVRSVPETRRMLERVAKEVTAVAKGLSVELSPDAVALTMTLIDNLPAGGTASMQRDIMEGRPSELASQSGAVARLGLEAGVPTPMNSFIYSALLPLEMRARGEIEF